MKKHWAIYFFSLKLVWTILKGPIHKISWEWARECSSCCKRGLLLQSLQCRYCYCNGNYYYNCFVTSRTVDGDRIRTYMQYRCIYTSLKETRADESKTAYGRHRSSQASLKVCLLFVLHHFRKHSSSLGVFGKRKENKPGRGELHSFYARLAFIIWSIYIFVGAHFFLIHITSSTKKNHLLFQCQCHASKHEGLVRKNFQPIYIFTRNDSQILFN